MGRAAKWTFSQGWKYRKAYTRGGVLEGKPFPLPFRWLFCSSPLADLRRTQPPRQKEGSLPNPLGRTEAFWWAHCWAPLWWLMERRPEWEPVRGMLNAKGLEKKVRAVSEMLTQLKTQSKATESSFSPWSCVWVDVNTFLSGVGLGEIRTTPPPRVCATGITILMRWSSAPNLYFLKLRRNWHITLYSIRVPNDLIYVYTAKWSPQ